MPSKDYLMLRSAQKGASRSTHRLAVARLLARRTICREDVQRVERARQSDRVTIGTSPQRSRFPLTAAVSTDYFHEPRSKSPSAVPGTLSV